MFKKIIRFFSNLFNKKTKKEAVKKPAVKKQVADYSPQTKEKEFQMLYETMTFLSMQWKTKSLSVAKKVLKYKVRYMKVEAKTGVPWEVIGQIHQLEAGGDFTKILHNGEKLPIKKTKKGPKGRGPFNTWEESAIDALNIKKSPKHWTIGNTLDYLERYNGLGYRKYHSEINTPYLWSGSNHYTKGKYIEVKRFGRWRSKWKPNLVSKQVGGALVLKQLQYKGRE